MSGADGIRAVVFDFGGVIWDMRLDLARAIEERYGLPRHALMRTLYDTDDWRRVHLGLGDREAWRAAAHRALEAEAGRPLPPLHDEWTAGMRLIEDNVALVRRLRPSYRTQVLSNADATLPERMRLLGVYDLFDDVVVSAHVGVAKPDRRIYELAASRLALSPEACVFIDDSERNVEAAREAGMRAVLFRVGRDDLRAQLAALGVDVGAAASEAS
ncbi:MAG TPA: HAD family phosphatase [Dehalococcoidia bacterium]|nr:HAD family phosphatase [Dehalococcoidia bacterium]